MERNKKGWIPYFGNENGFGGVDKELLEILDRGWLGCVRKFETCLGNDRFGGILPLLLNLSLSEFILWQISFADHRIGGG